MGSTGRIRGVLFSVICLTAYGCEEYRILPDGGEQDVGGNEGCPLVMPEDESYCEGALRCEYGSGCVDLIVCQCSRSNVWRCIRITCEDPPYYPDEPWTNEDDGGGEDDGGEDADGGAADDGDGCPDRDGDGFTDHHCGGLDCDDTDPSIHPDAPDIICDGIDQDCDGEDAGCDCPDEDGDGYEADYCGGLDCDDSDPTIHPGAVDLCGDGIDQDCDSIDPHCDCPDRDGDGYQPANPPTCGGTDCCDSGTEEVLGCTPESAPDIHPGAGEICEDGIDQDCNGWDAACECPDADGDGYTANDCGGTDCDDADSGVHPGAEEICEDGIDQNCDGWDAICGCNDDDGDGYTAEACGGADCDDSDPTIHPGAYDWCEDGIDQDCDGFDEQCKSGN